MTLSPEQRVLRARIAAHSRWAQENPAVNAARGQQGLRARFDRQAREAEPGLTDAEYERRGEHLYKQHMARLALASSKARKRVST